MTELRDLTVETRATPKIGGVAGFALGSDFDPTDDEIRELAALLRGAISEDRYPTSYGRVTVTVYSSFGLGALSLDILDLAAAGFSQTFPRLLDPAQKSAGRFRADSRASHLRTRSRSAYRPASRCG